MTARTLSVSGLEARHFPDFSIEKDHDDNKTRVELPGKVQIGVVVEGVFVPIAERKAAGLFADIERARNDTQQQG